MGRKYIPRHERLKAYAPYKSKYESVVAAWMEGKKIPFTYEGATLKYNEPSKGVCLSCLSKEIARTRNYVPDFWVFPNGKLNPEKAFILETKGKFASTDRTKMMAVIAAYPSYTFRMLFMRDNKLNKNSKTRYSDWCKRNNIQYAIGTTVPDEWVKPTKRRKKV